MLSRRFTVIHLLGPVGMIFWGWHIYIYIHICEFGRESPSTLYIETGRSLSIWTHQQTVFGTPFFWLSHQLALSMILLYFFFLWGSLRRAVWLLPATIISLLLVLRLLMPNARSGYAENAWFGCVPLCSCDLLLNCRHCAECYQCCPISWWRQ